MQKLENKTLQNFLERFIESLKHEKEYGYNDLISNQLDIPFIVSSLYQSFKNNPSDYMEFMESCFIKLPMMQKQWRNEEIL